MHESLWSAEFERKRAVSLSASNCLLLEKSNFHVGFCSVIFCRLVISNWFETGIYSVNYSVNYSGKELDLHISSEQWIKDKCCAQGTGPGCLLFYIFTWIFSSVEILTKQFTIFGMLMAVKLHQKRDLLLNWQNVSGRNQL